MIGRLVESVLRQHDSEDRELVVRWRLLKSRWVPYRVREFVGYDEKADKILWGPTEWVSPDHWKRFRRWLA